MVSQTGQEYDQAIQDIAHYVYRYEVKDERVLQCARTCLLDTLGCAIETVAESEDVRNMIGPVVPGTQVPNGFKLPGTSYCVDPVKGSFDLGTMIRYLDHNDGMIGKEWGHPSDNIGAILPVMDWMCREQSSGNQRPCGPPLTVRTLLEAIVKAHEIQGCMQIENAFNEIALDHTILVKLASASVVPWLLGLSEEQAMACISHVWMDGAASRLYRHGANTIPRKGWAAGDACMRAVHFALLVRSGQLGAPTVLSMPRWGFYASTWRGKGEFVLPLKYGDWAIRNNFYKVMPVEGHGIAPIEAALVQLHKMRNRGLRNPAQDIFRIIIRTNAAAKLIIDKPGKLHNAADRDHCMQYVVAVSLLKGATPEVADYADDSPFANSREIQELSRKMIIMADDVLTADYHNLKKRSIAGGVTIHLSDGSALPEVLVEYPTGHIRRQETLGRIQEKFQRNMALLFSPDEITEIEGAVLSKSTMQINELVDMLVRPGKPKMNMSDFVDLLISPREAAKASL